MQAAVYSPADRAIRVEEVEDPVAGEGQLLVRVKAAGLNRADLLLRSSKPVIAGAELAGEIVAVGAGVTGWSPGDRVMGRGQGYAELAVIDAATSTPVPEKMSWEEAGALPVALLTMHDALATNGRLGKGQAVLINAATSGVGVVGIQIASLLGASTVIATSRSADKLGVLQDFLGSLRSDVIFVDSTKEDVAALALEITQGRGVEVIVDNVGGSVLTANLTAAAIGGRIVQVGRLGGRTDTLDLDELARKRISLIGVTFRTRTSADVEEVFKAAVADLGNDLIRCRPRIDSTYPLADARRAQEALARNEHVGKLVLVPR